MKSLTIFLTSGMGLTIGAIIIALAIIGSIALVLHKATRQKKWVKFTVMFLWFTCLMMAFDEIVGYRDRGLSLLVSLGSGAIFTLCFFLSDRKRDKQNNQQ